MVQTSFYSDNPNYATSYPTQNDSNTNKTTGNTQAPSSFYPNGTQYTALISADTLTAAVNASAAAAAASASAASTSATAAAASLAAMSPSGATPLMDGVAAAGTSTNFARGDHVHPTDTSRAPLASPALTGTPTAPTAAALDNSTKLATTAYVDTADALKAPLASPALTGTPTAPTATAGTNTTQLATTAFVLANGTTLSSATPLMNGTAAVGVATAASHGDHVHPTDTSRAPLASPALTGTPTAPTAAALTNNTQIATTAYADTADALKAPLASPALTGTPTAPTAAKGTNSTQLATTAYADRLLLGPAFSAYQSTFQSLAAGSNTKVSFQTEEYDTANCFDSTTNYRFTPNVAGYYQINACFQIAGTGVIALNLYKNGAVFKNGAYIQTSLSYPANTFGSLVYLNGSTDYVEMYAYCSTAVSTGTGQAVTWVNGYLARLA